MFSQLILTRHVLAGPSLLLILATNTFVLAHGQPNSPTKTLSRDLSKNCWSAVHISAALYRRHQQREVNIIRDRPPQQQQSRYQGMQITPSAETKHSSQHLTGDCRPYAASSIRHH
ncbi:hypothetical protein GGR55DRAFT_483135 [Xylaria sp. FL0064]|nr:hypothetical protein GGR55DRAFT_483135 [Xylaria sp. FL0064]